MYDLQKKKEENEILLFVSLYVYNATQPIRPRVLLCIRSQPYDVFAFLNLFDALNTLPLAYDIRNEINLFVWIRHSNEVKYEKKI